MTTHAKLSPSKAHRWILCPGSVREEAKYPDERSPSAMDGTHTHTLLEKCIKNQQWNALAHVGEELTDHDGTFTIDEARAKRVNIVLDYIWSRTKDLQEFQLCEEQRVNPGVLLDRDDVSGTCDVSITCPDWIEIVDLKDGNGLVTAEENWQLILYALGRCAAIGVDTIKPDTPVRLTIVQPKLAARGLNPISSWEIPFYLLQTKRVALRGYTAATDDENAPLIPGEKQCQWCKARSGCTARANSMLQEVNMLFSPVTVQPVDLVHQAADKDPAVMDNDQLRQIMEAAPLLRKFLDEVAEEIKKRLEQGKPLPGFKLVHGKGSRVWSLTEEEMAEKLKKMGIPKDALYVSKLVSPAQAEKLTWSKKDGTQVSLSPRQLKRMNDEYVSRIAGKPTVAPESDSRPAVIIDASDLFTMVEEPVADLPSWLV